MQFPRYEFVVPEPRPRTPRSLGPRPRVTRPGRRSRSVPRVLRVTRRSPGALDVQQYLSLEFSVDERR